ncbi:DUF3970 family protein [Candidatus Dojkabacteria bacterium]|jgi:hypothetical protein|nr:DUF3970 family protein [Candidatus Dojkabacteria bacterium]
MIQVVWDGNKLTLSANERPNTAYPELNRLCSKLERRGFEIQHTGQGNKRYAIPINPKYAHPKDTFTIGKIVEVEV